MADETPGIEPGEVVGHVEPDTGQGEAAESEIPVGVDALSEEQKQAAQERGGGEDGEDGGALDVSAIVAEGGDETEGAAADEAGPDATEMTDADAQVAPNTGEA
jgi:hypothetical protein